MQKNCWNLNIIQSDYLLDKNGNIVDFKVEPKKRENYLLEDVNSKISSNPENFDNIINFIKSGIVMENGKNI